MPKFKPGDLVIQVKPTNDPDFDRKDEVCEVVSCDGHGLHLLGHYSPSGNLWGHSPDRFALCPDAEE